MPECCPRCDKESPGDICECGCNVLAEKLKSQLRLEESSAEGWRNRCFRLQPVVDSAVLHRKAFKEYNRVCNRKHTPNAFSKVQTEMQLCGVAARFCVDTYIRQEEEA